MFRVLLTAYFYTILGAYSTTVILLMSGFGWGALPHKYLKAVLYFQSLYAKSESLYHKIIEKDASSLLQQKLFSTNTNIYDKKLEQNFYSNMAEKDLIEVNLEFLTSGMDLSTDYKSVEPRSINEIMYSKVPLLNIYLDKKLWNLLLYTVSLIFRIRLALLISSFGFIAVCCILACFISFSDRAKTRIAVIYCRLYTAGTGLVARYHNSETNRPVRPGVAVANHLSPNDIQIICADVPYTEPSRDYLYTVTGQKHQGIIWAIERLVEKLCPSIWLERARPEERKNFTKINSGPILLFPEGYCTNNNKVLQFRRAIFEHGINIYPIAFKQDARFGDSFWSEDRFLNYLIRLLTSWAIVYDVIYLPVERKNENETNDEFAARVQEKIAEAADLPTAKFDGGFFYKSGMAATERKKHLFDIQVSLARKLLHEIAVRENNNIETALKDNLEQIIPNFYARTNSLNSADLLL